MADVAQLAKEWWLLAVLGVVSLVCGVLAIVYPDVTLLAVGIIFGFYLLMAGIFELVDAIVGDPASRALSAIVGVVALLAGLICLRRPGDSLLAIVVVLGAYLIVTGVARLVRAFASVEHRGLSLLDRGHRPHPGHPHPLLARREPRHPGGLLRHLAHLPRRVRPGRGLPAAQAPQGGQLRRGAADHRRAGLIALHADLGARGSGRGDRPSPASEDACRRSRS